MSISSISIRHSKIFCWWNCLVHLSEPGTLVTARPKRAVPAWERRHWKFLKYRGVSWSLFLTSKLPSLNTQQHASSRLKAFRSASSKVCWTVWMLKSCQIDLTHQALLLATTQQLHLRQLQLAWVRESSKSHRLLKMPPEIVPTCHLCIFMPLLRFHSCKNEGVTFGSSTRPAGTVWAAAPDTDLTSTAYQSHEALGKKIVTEYHGSN